MDTSHALEVVEQNEADTLRLMAPLMAERGAIAKRIQRLTWDVLAGATADVDSSTVTHPQLVAHYLCTRLHDDFRAVLLLVGRGHTIPALSLGAAMLEFAFTVSWIGTNTLLADRWLTWTDENRPAYGNVWDAINLSLASANTAHTESDTNREYAHYTTLCQLKHGNPTERRQFGVDLDDKGQPRRFASDEMNPEFVYHSRLALWYGARYLLVGLCNYNDFHTPRQHHEEWRLEIDGVRVAMQSRLDADVIDVYTARPQS